MLAIKKKCVTFDFSFYSSSISSLELVWLFIPVNSLYFNPVIGLSDLR